jgi:hypothetical protein
VVVAIALLWSGDVGLLWRAAGGVALALATLMRPEGLLVAGLLLGVRAWQDRRAGGWAWGRIAAALLPYTLIVAPYEIWRMSFYGYPFPNTFYTKTGASFPLIVRGLQYCAEFVAQHWLVGLLVAGGVLPVLTRWRHRNTGAEAKASGELYTALGVLTAGYTLYIVWAGGDYFPAGRFFAPLLAPCQVWLDDGGRPR